MVAGVKDAAAALTTRGKLAKFVPFTDESLKKINDRIAKQATTVAEERCEDKEGEKTAGSRVVDDRKDKPNTAFVAGKQFPEKFGSFPPELYGKPIEDLDEYYSSKYVSMLSWSYPL